LQSEYLIDLREELRSYGENDAAPPENNGLFVELRLRDGDRELSFFSTHTVFNAPADVTLSELGIEAFYPADPETAATIRGA
jgi:hypothetical protein